MIGSQLQPRQLKRNQKLRQFEYCPRDYFSKQIILFQAAVAGPGAEIEEKIKAQGDAVRKLKTAKADKAEIDGAVKLLLQLKADFKAATGNEWKPAAAPEKKPEEKVQIFIIWIIKVVTTKLDINR